MVIYLKHPQHGTKVACSEDEAKADELKGWQRFQVGALLTPSEPVEIEKPDLSDLEDLRAQYAARFGKAPHHKKSLVTIRKELEAA